MMANLEGETKVTAAIEVVNLTKSYEVYRKDAGLRGSLRSFIARDKRSIKAVDDVSFTINEGEIVGFLGTNGAGKTTTLKMLAGILKPSNGTISIHGYEPFRRNDNYLKSISLVMGQKQQLSWDLAPLDTFRLNQAIYGIPSRTFQERVSEMSNLLDVGTVIDRPVRKLSLGERMKCELILSLLHHPRVLFLDEPTIGLDVNMQLAVRQFISEYNKTTGATVLLTSHYMADVEALAKRVILIDQGHVFFDGSLEELSRNQAPQKIVRLRFSSPVDSKRLHAVAEVHHLEGLDAQILVDREKIPGAVSTMLAKFPVEDISIGDIPIEKVLSAVISKKRREHAQVA